MAAGKTFSLELKLDDTPDDIAQVGNLLKESRFAHKYSDRLSIRNQDDHVRSEFNHLRSTIQSKSAFGGSTTQKQHQRLVVEEYQKIPESKRTEIENILHRTKARDSVKILDSKTYSVNPSVMGSPCRSQYGSISHMATHVVEEPYTKKPSSFNAYKNGQPTTVINQNAHQRLRQID